METGTKKYAMDGEVFNIVRVQLRTLEPVKAVIPFQDATMGPFPTFGITLLTLESEDGYIGEAPAYASYTNILESCLLPILLHEHGLPYSELYRRMYWSIRNEGFRGPASALLGQIDMALHDLAARRAGVALHAYLRGAMSQVSGSGSKVSGSGSKVNGAGSKVKMYGSGGGTNYSMEELEREIVLFREFGIDCFKMKVGKNGGASMQEDVVRVRFARQLLGRDVRLAVDANQIWSVEEALEFIDLTAGEELAWLEEPIHSAAYDHIEYLCKRTPLTIAYGESERSSRGFPALVNAGVRHLQPVPTHLAGIREWMEVQALAERSKVDLSSGGYTMFTSFLLTLAPEGSLVEYLHSIMSGLNNYFCVRPGWKDGCFILPEIEGLPVRVDWEYCEKENKVIKTQAWDKKNVSRYEAIVSL